jgi:hypothetical protein
LNAPGQSPPKDPPPAKPIEISWADEVKIPQQEWVVKDLLPAKGTAFLYGPSKAGKSFVALRLGYEIAAGNDVLGRRTKQCGVAFVAAEAPEGVKKRVVAIRQRRKKGGKKVPFLIVKMQLDLAKPESPDVPLLADAIISELKRLGIRLGVLIIDTLACVTPGMDESSSRDTGIVMTNVRRLQQLLDCLVLIVHHSGKDEERGMRGHSSLGFDADVVLSLSGKPPNRTLTAEKVKDAKDGMSWPVTLVTEPLGQDGDGDDITSCVAEFGDEQAGQRQAAPLKLDARPAIMLGAMVALASEMAGQPRPKGCPVLPHTIALDFGQVADKAMSMGLRAGGANDPKKAKDATRKACDRAMETLISKDIVAAKDDWRWLTPFGLSQARARTN